MDSEKYKRKVTLVCPTCGNTQFEYEDDLGSSNQLIRCPSCNSEFAKEELIRKNKRVIDNNVDEMKKEVIKDVEKEIKNIFKNLK